jgi:hypothetical protein
MIVFAFSITLADGGSCCWENRTQMWGSALTYSLISAYLLAAFVYLYRSHRDTVSSLRSLVADPLAVDVALRDLRAPLVVWAAIAGALFGVSQFAEVLFPNRDSLSSIPDVPLILGNTLLWMVAALLTVSRVHDAVAMRRLGRHIEIDLYNLGRLRPIGRAAVRDVLVVMGPSLSCRCSLWMRSSAG